MVRSQSRPTSNRRAPGGDRKSETRVQHAEPEPDAPVTAARVAAARARLVPIADAQLAALESMRTRDEYIAAGKTTQSANTQENSLAFLVVAGEQLRAHAESIECEPVFLSYFNHQIEALESARGGQSAAAPVDRTEARNRAARRARAARNGTIRKLRLVCSGNEHATAELERTLGSADTLVNLKESLGRLIALGRRWLRDGDATVQARAATFKLTVAALDQAARAQQDLVDTSGDAFGNTNQDRDTPDVNLAEGRVLYAMKTLYEIFEAAHQDNPLVRRLIPAPGTRKFIVGHRGNAATGDEPAAPGATTGTA